MSKEKYRNPTSGLTLDQVEDLLADTLALMHHGYRLPFMQWFEDDFRGSEGVEEMASLERLMYRQLLAKAWASKDAPYLPINEDKLKRLSDCPGDDLWAAHRENVLAMFKESKIPGKMYHPRQMVDYVCQLSKVIINTNNGRKGGKPPKPETNEVSAKTEPEPVEKDTEIKPNGYVSLTEMIATGSNPLSEMKPIKNKNENKNLEKESERELEPKTETPNSLKTKFPENGQEDETMKAKTEMQVVTLRITGEGPENYKWAEVTILEKAFGSATVISDYEDWLNENKHEDFRGKPITKYLKVAPQRLVRETDTEIDTSAVVALSRDITYTTDNVINCKDREKPGLNELLKTYTHEEIVAAARQFNAELNKDNLKNLDFAAKNFVEGADNMLYTARRKKAEKATEAEAVTRKAAELQAEAERERVERLAAREREQELVDEELPD